MTNKNPQETIVISIDGKLIVPNKIDTNFLAKFKTLIIDESGDKNLRFILITGGGNLRRQYQKATNSILALNDQDIDWLGIHATRLNGQLLTAVFHSISYPEIITDVNEILDVPDKYKLIVTSGYRPGTSTDLQAIKIANLVHASKVINLSHVDYIYDKNPNTHNDAKPLMNLSWTEFLKIVSDTWDPTHNTPFDPQAARLAQEHNLNVAHISGFDLSQVKNYLNDEAFVGTKLIC